MRFPQDNKIVFGQDMSWWACIPHNIDFDIDEIQKDGKMWLSAPGYGGEPYGNGQIVVYLKTVEDILGKEG